MSADLSDAAYFEAIDYENIDITSGIHVVGVGRFV